MHYARPLNKCVCSIGLDSRLPLLANIGAVKRSAFMTFPISKSPWNKGKLVGQKLPLKLEQIWAIRIRLEIVTCSPQD